ncbi:conserved hypothetical protein [Mucor ambiguus]|uniref:HCP-like protein n=1 Tax=Mucor ambiguus TaxID=91626 RepID=A0A0C9MX70_9FUNG|nr:conserved hypothetical protein [Mucor ambiguus]
MIDRTTATNTHQYQTKPLERMDIVRDEKTIVNQIQHLLLVEDDEIFDNDGDDEDEEDQDQDFTDLPPTLNSPDLTRTESTSSDFSRIQYVDSIRKTRPLPKIPDRISSKELPTNMTAIMSESFKNNTRVSAQQLFQMLNQSKPAEDEEQDTSDDDVEYGGVYALKTQMPSPTLSNREVLKQYYEELNLNYKTMTPVEEVDEDQFITNYALEPSPEYNARPVSQISLQPPSLASGRSSPTSSRNSSQSIDLPDPPLDFEFQTPRQGNAILQTTNQQPTESTQQKFDTVNGISSLYATPTDGYSYGAPRPSLENVCEANEGTPNHQDAPSNRLSLYGDVQKLSELNQALMTPEISNSSIPAPAYQQPQHEQLSRQAMHNSQQQQQLQALVSVGSYNKRADSRVSMASASLVHDKESMKTYRRMATKTNDRNIQFTYAKYLMQLVSLYIGSKEPSVVATRDRLQEEAEYWVDKLAKSNHAAALYTKGQWLRHCGDIKAIGIFVGAQYKKVNHAKAFKCFQQAAKYGSVEAYYELAEYWMVRKDYKKSMDCYRYAASKQHILSLYKLANILLRGLLHQQKDIQQGLIYLRQAADSEKPDCARSAYDLACILSNDLKSIDLENECSITTFYITPNATLAMHYFKKADSFGLVNATFRLGQLYKEGQQQFHPNAWEAYKCFARVAEHGNEDAMIELAHYYKDGISGYLSPQPLLAFQWCHKATENGNPVADYVLGTFYEHGIGVYPDQAKAQEWYNKSASKRYGPAEERLHIKRSSSNQQVLRQQKPHEHTYSHPSQNGSKMYYEESVRLAETSRRTHAEQNCLIM